MDIGSFVVVELYTKRFPVLHYGIKQPSKRVENINSIFSLKLKSEKTTVNWQIVCTTVTDGVTGANSEYFVYETIESAVNFHCWAPET